MRQEIRDIRGLILVHESPVSAQTVVTFSLQLCHQCDRGDRYLREFAHIRALRAEWIVQSPPAKTGQYGAAMRAAHHVRQILGRNDLRVVTRAEHATPFHEAPGAEVSRIAAA